MIVRNNTSMKTPFYKAIEEIKNIKMTSHEKEMMMKRIINVPLLATQVKRTVKSSWTVYSFTTWIQSHRMVTAFAALLIVVFGGNSVVLASYDTVPGDTLYPVKTAIIEPVRLALAPTTTARAEVRAEIVQSRLQEVEILAARDVLDEEKEMEIREHIDTQVAILNEDLEKVRERDNEKALEINTTLEASMNAHDRVIKTIAASRGRGGVDAVTTVAASSGPVGATMMMSVAADPTENVTVATEPAVAARMIKASTVPENSSATNAFDDSDESIENTSGTADKSTKRNKDKTSFNNKKASVESLIKTVSESASSTSSKRSAVQENIVNDARDTIDRARQKLVEADKRDEGGDDEGAYSALVDSERSAKEASILIKANVRLEKEVKKPSSVKVPVDREEEIRGSRGDDRGDDKDGSKRDEDKSAEIPKVDIKVRGVMDGI